MRGGRRPLASARHRPRPVSSIALLGRTLAPVHECAYPRAVPEWDPAKAARNLRKHGVDFADAADVFFDPLALSMPDEDPDEARFVAIGADGLGRLLVVIYTWRDDAVRLISARRATASERRQYEKRR